MCIRDSHQQARPAQPQRDSPAPVISQPPPVQITVQSASPAPSVVLAEIPQERPRESRELSRAPADPLTAWATTLVESIRSAPDTSTVLMLVFQSLSALFPLLPING